VVVANKSITVVMVRCMVFILSTRAEACSSAGCRPSTELELNEFNGIRSSDNGGKPARMLLCCPNIEARPRSDRSGEVRRYLARQKPKHILVIG